MKRFGGKLGSEYHLFQLSVPYYKQMQNTVGKTIHAHFQKKKLSLIRAIEIGYGTGLTTKTMFQTNPQIRIIGIDNEPVMYQIAKKNLKKYIKANCLQLEQADALSFLKQLPTASVNAVGSAFTIHNFHPTYRNQLLQQIYRILAPEGIFVNADKYALDNTLAHKASLEWQFEQYIRAFIPIKRSDLVTEWMLHDLQDEKIIPTEEKTIQQLQSIGFKKVKKIFRKKIHATIFAVK